MKPRGKYYDAAKERMARLLGARFGPVAAKHKREMPAVYEKFLSNALIDRMQSVGDSAPELFNNRNELKLAKASAVDVAQLYDFVLNTTGEELEKLETLDGGEKDRNFQIEQCLQKRIAAGQIMNSVLKNVVELSGKVQEIENTKRHAINTQDLGGIVAQFVEAVHDVLGDSEDMLPLVQEIALRIKQIKLPRSGPEGTEITPDQDVLEMDATIPRLAG